MIDPTSIVQGVATSIAAQKAMPHIDQAIHDATHDDQEPRELTEKDYLHLIHLTLVDMILLLKKQSSGAGDIYKFITLYKPMFGSPWHPYHIHDLLHFEIYSPVAIVLNCSGTGLGNFNLSIPVCIWTPVDFLGGASFQLDASNAFNQIVVSVRDTNEEVV